MIWWNMYTLEAIKYMYTSTSLDRKTSTNDHMENLVAGGRIISK